MKIRPPRCRASSPSMGSECPSCDPVVSETATGDSATPSPPSSTRRGRIATASPPTNPPDSMVRPVPAYARDPGRSTRCIFSLDLVSGPLCPPRRPPLPDWPIRYPRPSPPTMQVRPGRRVRRGRRLSGHHGRHGPHRPAPRAEARRLRSRRQGPHPRRQRRPRQVRRRRGRLLLRPLRVGLGRRRVHRRRQPRRGAHCQPLGRPHQAGDRPLPRRHQ